MEEKTNLRRSSRSRKRAKRSDEIVEFAPRLKPKKGRGRKKKKSRRDEIPLADVVEIECKL